MGMLWPRYRERFPRMQVQPPRPPMFERLGDAGEGTVPEIVVEFGYGVPSPLVWFVSGDDDNLIQVQQNRFVFNWRSRGSAHPAKHMSKRRFGALASLCRVPARGGRGR